MAKVSTTLGYLLTDTSLSGTGSAGSGIVRDAVTKAKYVWDSNVLSSWTLPAGVYTAFTTGSTPYPKRIYMAAYYYALEQITEEFIRLKLGQIGLAENSRFVEMILMKADKLYAIAQAGIKAYEEWARETAAQLCSDTLEFITTLVTSVDDGTNKAQSFWNLVPTDLIGASYAGLSLSSDYAAWVEEFAYGHALRNVGTKLMQKSYGKSSGKNPQIAAYYQASGAALEQAGTKIVESWKAWAEKNKNQISAMSLGL